MSDLARKKPLLWRLFQAQGKVWPKEGSPVSTLPDGTCFYVLSAKQAEENRKAFGKRTTARCFVRCSRCNDFYPMQTVLQHEKACKMERRVQDDSGDFERRSARTLESAEASPMKRQGGDRRKAK